VDLLLRCSLPKVGVVGIRRLCLDTSLAVRRVSLSFLE
jgi:hypothetical protein